MSVVSCQLPVAGWPRFSVCCALFLATINWQLATVFAAEIPPGLEPAIDRGLAFLQKQQKADGSFDAVGPGNAMTGLSLLAFMASGHTPEAGRYGLTVKNALDYLAKQEPEAGYFGRDGGRMYGHCIVTIALAESYGMEMEEPERQRVALALDRCLKVICDAQDVHKEPDAVGGWRYEPLSPDSDLSVTGWCLLALRACQNAGLPVPPQRVDRAVQYVLRRYRADQKGFAYQAGSDATASMTAVAVLNLCLAGAGDRDELGVGAKFLTARLVQPNSPYWYYSMYYTTQAAYQSGEATWAVVWRHNYHQLLSAQRRDDGSWPAHRDEPGGDSKPGRVYPTAMSCLTLAVPLRLLPMYQK
jgi:hypothetical protein